AVFANSIGDVGDRTMNGAQQQDDFVDLLVVSYVLEVSAVSSRTTSHGNRRMFVVNKELRRSGRALRSSPGGAKVPWEPTTGICMRRASERVVAYARA